MVQLVIYGCTGYTAQLVLGRARSSRSISIVVAGRTDGKVKAVAARFGVDYRIFDLNDCRRIDEFLEGIAVVLNCSGSFKYTSEPLMRACIRKGAHYIDIAAELDSYQLAAELNQQATHANVLLMPGCGGSVAMLGSLAKYAIEGASNPVSMNIALHVAGAMSRGSLMCASEGLASCCLRRENGILLDQDPKSSWDFDFGDGKGTVPCFPVTMLDLITIFKSTKVPTIQTFVHISTGKKGLQSKYSRDLPNGPTEKERNENPYHAAVVVECEDGAIRRALLHTVNGYTFTAEASLEAARIILEGVEDVGFQTPADTFGTRFVERIAGTRMERIE